MNKQSMLSLAVLATAALSASSMAGLVVTNTGTLPTTWPTGPDGTSPEVSTQTTTNPSSGSVSLTLGAQSVIGQTFTVGSTFDLGSIAIVGSGGPGGLNIGVNLFAMNNTYTPATSGGYVPATSFASGNLLGGGSGLTFTFSGSANNVMLLDFTADDEITLTAGTTYAFELWNLGGTGGTFFLQRGGETYAGGSVFQATSPTAQSATSSDSRNNVAGGTRDAIFTAYAAAAPVPEPATLAALGFGALALMRRRRR